MKVNKVPTLARAQEINPLDNQKLSDDDRKKIFLKLLISDFCKAMGTEIESAKARLHKANEELRQSETQDS